MDSCPGRRRDPITFELIRHALSAIADQMAVTVVRTARSTVSKEVRDFSTALCTADGELVALGLCLPLMLGSIPAAMRVVRERFGHALHHDDLYVLNDPYEGGSHLPDIYMFKPVFVGDTLLGFACTVTHHADIGGIAPGGISAAATEIYQEGLRIPPLRLVERGVPNDTLLALIRSNVRVPDVVMGDLASQMAACAQGHDGLRALADEHGAGTVRWYLRELLDHTEAQTRQALRGLPDGVFRFEDHLDDDGHGTTAIPIRVAVHKTGDDLLADFSGTAPQVRGAINMTRSYTLSCVYFAVRCLLGPSISNTEGFFRPLRVRTEAGTIVDAEPPASVASRVLTAFRVSDVLFGALAQMAPGRMPACGMAIDANVSVAGVLPDGRPFLQLDWVPGSWGGRPGRDGLDHHSPLNSNFSNTPVEVIEADAPLRVEEYSLVPDSAGPGQYRGGLGVRRRWRLLGGAEAQVSVRTDRLRFRPYGLWGAGSGRPGHNLLEQRGRVREMPSKFRVVLQPGDWVQIETAGAGGWGDPLARDPRRVLADVQEGRIAAAHAREAYGVVLREGEDAVDEAATEARRSRAGAAPGVAGGTR
jgi:N-methylhydantoinase B